MAKDNRDFWKPMGSLTADDLGTLLGKPERRILDYKRCERLADVDQEALTDDLCALANGMGGRLVYGAEEGEIDELAALPGVPDRLIGKLRSKIRSASHTVQPPVSVDVQDVPLGGGKSAVIVEVSAIQSRQPHQHNGTYRIRSSDNNTFMNHSTVVSMILAQRNQSGFIEARLTLKGHSTPPDRGRSRLV